MDDLKGMVSIAGKAVRYAVLAFVTFVAISRGAGGSEVSDRINPWWGTNNGATLGWFGLARPLKSGGLSVTGEAKELFLGQLAGGLPNQSRGNWNGEVKMKFLYDFESLFGIKGLSMESNWRERYGGNPQYAAGAYNLFNPTVLSVNAGLRILTQQIEYSTPNKTVTINAGWENPYEQFLQQPLSKFFENSMITQSKGIGGQTGPGMMVVNPVASPGGNPASAKNPVYQGSYAYRSSPVPWNSSYAAWGGTLKIKPGRSLYIQSGLYLAISGTGGTLPTQYTPTSVYPYTSVPKNYLGTLRRSGQIVPFVDGTGKVVPNAPQNMGWISGYQNNHGFNFQGSPKFSPNTAELGKGATSAANERYSTERNQQGKWVQGSRYNYASPYDPGSGGNYSENGIYNVNEIGWEPKLGKDRLEGKYAIGSYLWGQQNTAYTPTAFTPSGTADVSYAARKPAASQENQITWGLYLQADQQYFREKGSDPSKLSRQGLYGFNEFTFTPPQNNQLPFYFQTGLVYRGLIPHRDEDLIGIALGAGFYSSYYNDWIQSQNKQLQFNYGTPSNAAIPDGPAQYQPAGTTNSASAIYVNGKPKGTKTPASVTQQQQGSPLKDTYAYLPTFTSTEIIEAFYNIQLTPWAMLKPSVQYIVNPAGNGTVQNDWILGVSTKVTF